MSEQRTPFGEDKTAKSKEGVKLIVLGILLLVVSIVILSLGNKISLWGFGFGAFLLIFGISKVASRR